MTVWCRRPIQGARSQQPQSLAAQHFASRRREQRTTAAASAAAAWMDWPCSRKASLIGRLETLSSDGLIVVLTEVGLDCSLLRQGWLRSRGERPQVLHCARIRPRPKVAARRRRRWPGHCRLVRPCRREARARSQDRLAKGQRDEGGPLLHRRIQTVALRQGLARRTLRGRSQPGPRLRPSAPQTPPPPKPAPSWW